MKTVMVYCVMAGRQGMGNVVGVTGQDGDDHQGITGEKSIYQGLMPC